MKIDELPCTIALEGGLMVDVAAAEEPRQLTLRGAPGYAAHDARTDPADPDDEALTAPPLHFEIDTPFGPLDCELDTGSDGLVALAMSTLFDNPTDEAFAAALDAYRGLYEVWEAVLQHEPVPRGAPAQASLPFPHALLA